MERQTILGAILTILERLTAEKLRIVYLLIRKL